MNLACPEQIQAFIQLPVDKPLHMLNYLKFKEKVAENGLSGKEQYDEYIKAAMPFLAKAEAKMLYSGSPKFTIIGPAEDPKWDKILIVEYPTKQHFFQMVTDKAYPAHLRKMALEDSRLFFCEGEWRWAVSKFN